MLWQNLINSFAHVMQLLIREQYKLDSIKLMISDAFKSLWNLHISKIHIRFCKMAPSVTARGTVQLRSMLRQTFMSCHIWGLSNVTTLSFSMFIRGNFFWRRANPLSFLSIAFTKFFITPNLICKGGSSILFGSTRGWDWTLCEPGINSCLHGHSCFK